MQVIRSSAALSQLISVPSFSLLPSAWQLCCSLLFRRAQVEEELQAVACTKHTTRFDVLVFDTRLGQYRQFYYAISIEIDWMVMKHSDDIHFASSNYFSKFICKIMRYTCTSFIPYNLFSRPFFSHKQKMIILPLYA